MIRLNMFDIITQKCCMLITEKCSTFITHNCLAVITQKSSKCYLIKKLLDVHDSFFIKKIAAAGYKKILRLFY